MIQRELIIEPTDIDSISIQCKCRARVSLSLREHREIPSACPSCKKTWDGIASLVTDYFKALESQLDTCRVAFHIPTSASGETPQLTEKVPEAGKEGK